MFAREIVRRSVGFAEKQIPNYMADTYAVAMMRDGKQLDRRGIRIQN